MHPKKFWKKRTSNNKSPNRAIIIGGICGIIGAILGSVSSGLVTQYGERQKQRDLVMVESFKWHQQDGPVELMNVKLLFDQMRNLTFSNKESIERLATLIRSNPECANALNAGCKAVMIETIRINRGDVGSGAASAEDIDTLLTPAYDRAAEGVRVLKTQNQLQTGR